MRRTLGTLVLLPLLLVGCGEEETAADPVTSGSPVASSTPDPPVDPPGGGTPGGGTPGGEGSTVLGLVHETSAGGAVSDELVPVDAAFLGSLDSGRLGDAVRRLAAAHPPADGHRVLAAVVAVGCDVPPGVSVIGAADDSGTWTVAPDKVAAPLQECLAPVTTVAVVDVPPQG